MARAAIAYWLSRADYDAAKKLIPDLPDTFDEWLQEALRNVATTKATGREVLRVAVEPHRFEAWCKTCRLEPNETTLNGYAVAEAGKR